MTADRDPCPERLLWAVVRAFEAAVSNDEPDPAARLLLGLGGLLCAVDMFRVGDQPTAAAAMAEAIASAGPLMAELSAADASVANAATRGAAALAIMCGQTCAEVDALTACGLADEFVDLAGLARADIEVAWRIRRLSARHAARRGSAAFETSSPVAGASLH